MIISKLRGGLGNQLFQYAIGRQLAERQHTDLKLDLSYFADQTGITPREYKLGVFRTTATIATPDDETNVLGYSRFRPIKRRLWKMGIDLFHWNYLRETTFGFHPEVLQFKGSAILEGYWQSERYFDSIRPLLLQEIYLKEECISSSIALLLQQIKESLSVAVHVRRGDYVTSKIVNQQFGTCSLSYYNNAMNLMKGNLVSPEFYIFSDDIAWCEQHLDGLECPMHFISGNTDFEDLFLMSNCQHQIIANSSFSWWAAWLNPNRDKQVIAPKQWFADPNLNTSEVVPSDWIRL
jgi:hypothetical protein